MRSLTMAQVLLEEAEAIHDPDQRGLSELRDLKEKIALKEIEPDSAEEYEQICHVYAELQKHNSVALCLSGGGIRSATFGLGVLEALARHDLLKEFHYLSTVSGGGYIGSWLSAWIRRDGRDSVFRQLGVTRKQIEQPAAPPEIVPDREPQPLHALRADSNYLTPKLGLLSADTWTGIALYVRNLLMNWAVIGSFILAAVLLPLIVATLLGPVADQRPLGWATLAAAAILIVAALRIMAANRPTWGRQNIAQTPFIQRDLSPFFLAAIACVFALQTGIADPDHPWLLWPRIGPLACFLALFGCGGAALSVLGWLLGARPMTMPASGESCCRRIWDGIATAVAGAIFGLIVAGGVLLYARLAHQQHANARLCAVVSLVIGPLWILQAQVIGEAFLVGLRSGAARGADDREWLARSAGWYGAAGIGWALFCGLVLTGPAIVACLGGKLLASTGGVSGLVTTLLGKSSLTKFQTSSKILSVNVILAVAAPVFALCLVIGLSWAAALILYDQASAHSIGAPLDGTVLPPVLWLAGFVIIGLITSFFVNINRFSMHSVYRNRLIRAYLGASNPARQEKQPSKTLNQFTGFDQTDNICMSHLWAPKADDEHRAFLHVVNMALNVVSTRNLAWQERKAEPFTATALHSGSDRVGFRKTADYAQDLSLGTAMAISGAAASPNMGYHSSPSLTFLLALFNVRLGWWLGNPGPEGKKKLPMSKPAFQLDGPKLSALWLAREVFGLTTDDQAFVYLSDGGHFENLGLYEMVRRRCRLIVLSDAGCDPNFDFEDLGNAVRKIRIDLGIEISFSGVEALRKHRRPPADQKNCCPAPAASDAEASGPTPYWAIGTILYPEEISPGVPYLGHILYLKPGFFEDDREPADVRSYARASQTFPHESTADQWFSESQFESYRALGFHIMDAAITHPPVVQKPLPHRLRVIIDALRSA